MRRFAELELVAPRAGSFEQGDVTRVRLLAELERSGVDLDDLSAAVRAGRLSFGFAGQLISDPVGLTERTHGEALSQLGLDPKFVQRLQLALGLPTTSVEVPIREDDLELYTLVARALESGLSGEALIRILRGFGIGTRQIAEVQREHFRRNVEERLLAEGVPYARMLEITAALRIKLQTLGFRTVFLLHRRFLEQLVFENMVERVEETLEAQDIARTRERARAIVFVDLSGYTRLTEEAGDERAAEHGTRLTEIALRTCARPGGRLVKTLGDGVMLRFDAPAEAVAAALDIVARAAAEGLPPARAGVAWGAVIQRDADYFGRTVNLAARLVDRAQPGHVLVGRTVPESAGDERLSFHPAGSHALDGFGGPVPVFEARWRTPP